MKKRDHKTIPKRRLWAFRVITVMFPLLFFVLLELALRAAHYGGETKLFIRSTWKGRSYYSINPDIARRYFSRSGFTTFTSPDVFAVNKSPNAFRIFCLGASTTVGYPYLFNASFSSLLKDRLSVLLPEKHIEMVNVGVTAVNSFTVADFTHEIMGYEPDLLIVYMGHNEFYGALGVGSTEYGGANWAVVRLFLALRNLRTVQLVRDGISAASSLFSKEPQTGTVKSLMEEMAGEKTIRLHSPQYEKAREYFSRNISDIIETAQEHHVGLLMSTLVSNLRDQAPFVPQFAETTSVPTQERWNRLFEQGKAFQQKGLAGQALAFYTDAARLDGDRADVHFRMGQCHEDLNQYENAFQEYRIAKDLDALRFRATEEFNDIIRSLCKENGVAVVEMERAFSAHSLHGIPGNELILEHVHPNFEGYFLMAKEFCRALSRQHSVIPEQQWRWEEDKTDEQYRQNAGVTEFDLEAGRLRIEILKHRWPFREKTVQFLYQPTNRVQKVAWDYVNRKIGWGQAHEYLAGEFVKEGQFASAEREYLALAKQSTLDPVFLIAMGDLQVKQKNYEQAIATFQQALQIEETNVLHARLGELYYETRQPEEALKHFRQALGIDGQSPSPFSPMQRMRVSFLMGRSYVALGNLDAARNELDRVRSLAPEVGEVALLEREIVAAKSRTGQKGK